MKNMNVYFLLDSFHSVMKTICCSVFLNKHLNPPILSPSNISWKSYATSKRVLAYTRKRLRLWDTLLSFMLHLNSRVYRNGSVECKCGAAHHRKTATET